MNTAPHDNSGLDPQVLQWRDWLQGNRESMGRTAGLPAGSELAAFARGLLKADPDLVDWMFPADRYAAEKSKVPALSRAAHVALMDLGAMDARIRVLYVAYLELFGASCDWHGWVLAHSQIQPYYLLTELDAAGVRRMARVLRFVHLAGWRGYSTSGIRNQQDFWYDNSLRRWLLETWAAEGGRPETFPQLWMQAMLDSAGLPAITPLEAGEKSTLVTHLLTRCQRRVHQFSMELYGDNWQSEPPRRGPKPINKTL